VAKTYPHIAEMKGKALKAQFLDREGLHRKKELDADDPRRICPHLAPIAPPPTAELVASHVSRFSTNK